MGVCILKNISLFVKYLLTREIFCRLYKNRMIKSFADKETENLFCERRCRIDSKIQQRAMYKLAMLDSCIDIQLFKIPPSNQLEKLKGYPNRWSVRINQQWRLTFDWNEPDAYNVKVEDYH